MGFLFYSFRQWLIWCVWSEAFVSRTKYELNTKFFFNFFFGGKTGWFGNQHHFCIKWDFEFRLANGIFIRPVGDWRTLP